MLSPGLGFICVRKTDTLGLRWYSGIFNILRVTPRVERPWPDWDCIYLVSSSLRPILTIKTQFLVYTIYSLLISYGSGWWFAIPMPSFCNHNLILTNFNPCVFGSDCFMLIISHTLKNINASCQVLVPCFMSQNRRYTFSIHTKSLFLCILFLHTC